MAFHNFSPAFYCIPLKWQSNTILQRCRKWASLYKISSLHLISWCGNFVETHSFHRVLSDLLKTLRKCMSPKNFLNRKIDEIHYVKRTRIRSYFGPHFSQNFLHSDWIRRDTPYDSNTNPFYAEITLFYAVYSIKMEQVIFEISKKFHDFKERYIQKVSSQIFQRTITTFVWRDFFTVNLVCIHHITKKIFWGFWVKPCQ